MQTILVAALVLAAPPSKDGCGRCGIEQANSTLARKDVVRIVSQAASRRGGRLSRSQAEKAADIAFKESSFKPSAKNPRSRAYGLYQFMPKTWKSTGIRKTDCPYCQSEAFLAYVEGRYGSIGAALKFHQRRHWY